MSYEITLDIGKLLHYSSSLRSQIDNETLLLIIKSFSSYIRKLYLSSVEEAIYSNRYKGQWEPRDEEGYLEYLGTYPSRRSILSLMIEAVEIREIKNHIVIRVNPNFYYPESRHPLIEVLRAIDNGTSDFNARPVIKGIVRQINLNIPSLWRGYLKKKGVA